VVRTRYIKTGMSPGSLVYTGHPKSHPIVVDVMDFNTDQLHEYRTEDIEVFFPLRDTTTVSWIDVKGIHQEDLIARTGDYFHIHPLTLEDILNTQQRPKIEYFDNYIFIVMKMLQWDEHQKTIQSEQISILVGQHFVLSFQQKEDDIFDRLRERIRMGKGRIRGMGPDYLAYAMLDVAVDHYYLALEAISEHMEQLEARVLQDAQKKLLKQIYVLKRENLLLRKAVWPLREVVLQLERTDSPLVNKKTRPFIRDLYDHTIHVTDTIETHRDMTAGLLELYLSSVNNKTSEVMKVLTIIATLFIPLTFIVGIYGMNFDYMPELHWPWAYFAILAFMAALAAGMLIYFRKNKWI
jgi:magnesium transporter